MLNVQQELAAQRVESKLYFDVKRFFGMLLVWFVCGVFSFFPLLLRPMFTRAMTSVDMGYFYMVMSDNDVLYLSAVLSILAVGMAVFLGRRNSMFTYLLAFLEVVAIFLGMMGYLMLEGDPIVFGENVYMINCGFLIAAAVMAVVMFTTVSFRRREGVGDR